MFINEFIKIREKCLFCDSKMVPTLEKLLPASKINRVLKIDNNYKNGYFTFRSLSNNPSVMSKIDGISGNVEFKYSDSDNKVIDITTALISAAFNNYSPHVQVSCSNKKCNHMYYYISTNIQIINNIITGVNLSWESFNFENSWVQNDWIEQKTKIYSTSMPETDPIVIDLIPFDYSSKEKIFNKIKTIITFS